MLHFNRNNFFKESSKKDYLFSKLLTLITFYNLLYLFLSFFKFKPNNKILINQINYFHLESTLLQKLLFIAYAISILFIIFRKNFYCKYFSYISFFNILFIVLTNKWPEYEEKGFIIFLLLFIFPINKYFTDFFIFFNNKKIQFILIIILFFLFWLLPIIFPIYINNFYDLVFIQSHFSMTVLSGINFTSNFNLIENLNYGFAMPLLIDFFTKYFTNSNLNYISLLYAIYFYQIIALLLIGFLIYRLNKSNFYLLFIILILTVSYTLANSGVSISFPNQSGIRFIPFIFCLILFHYELQRFPNFKFFNLFIITLICIFCNFETGILLFIGILSSLFLFYIHNIINIKYFTKQLFILSIFVVLIFYFLKIPTYLSSNYKYFLSFNTGYGGFSDRLSINATFFLFISSYNIILILQNSKRLTKNIIWTFSISIMMFVWIFYYINRMTEWNLWFEWVLLIFLISKNFNLIKFNLIKFIITIFIFGQSFYSFKVASTNLSSKIHYYFYEKKRKPNFSFFYIMPDISNLNNKISELNNYNIDSTIVLSSLSTYIRVKGYNLKFPWTDIFDIKYINDNSISTWIDKKGSKFLLIDNPSSELSKYGIEYNNQILIITNNLKNYTQFKTTKNWLIFKRKI